MSEREDWIAEEADEEGLPRHGVPALPVPRDRVKPDGLVYRTCRGTCRRELPLHEFPYLKKVGASKTRSHVCADCEPKQDRSHIPRWTEKAQREAVQSGEVSGIYPPDLKDPYAVPDPTPATPADLYRP